MSKYSVSAYGQVQDTSGRYAVTKCRLTRNTGGSYFLGCCGLSGIESFNCCSEFKDWKDKAEMLACIYQYLYCQGTALYALTDQQLESPLHRALQEVGAGLVVEFPNLYHGPNMMHLFKVNIRNVAGRFCNKYGEAYAEPPKDDSDIIPEQNESGQSGVYQQLPVKN